MESARVDAEDREVRGRLFGDEPRRRGHARLELDRDPAPPRARAPTPLVLAPAPGLSLMRVGI